MMKKTQIIEKWAKAKKVETLLKSLDTKSENPNDIQELIQDIYLILLETDDDKIEKLYNKNNEDFYILRLLKNNLYSKTSQYYYKYKHKKYQFDDIDGQKDK